MIRIVHTLVKPSGKCRLSYWRKVSQWARAICLVGIPAVLLLLRLPVSYCGHVSGLKEQPWIGARFEQTCSRICLASSHYGLPTTNAPSLSLLASVSCHHWRSALPCLSVCLPGNIRDPCVGAVTSSMALEALQHQRLTDDSECRLIL